MVIEVHNATESFEWVKLFHALGGGAPFPVAPLGTPEWYTSALFCSVTPSVVLALGLIQAVVVVRFLRRVRPVVMPSRKPTGCLLLIVTALALGVLWLNVVWCLEAGSMSYQAVEQELPRAIEDITRFESAIRGYNVTVSNSLVQVRSLDTCCPTFDFTGVCVRKVESFQRDPRLKELETLPVLLDKMYMHLKPVPPVLTETEAQSGNLDRILVGTVVFTTVLITAFLIFIVCAAEFTVHLQGNIDHGINFCVLKSGSIPSCLIIVFMAQMAAVGLSVGIVLGNFCTDPDGNTLDMIELAANHTNHPAAVNQFAAYYIAGTGSHPMLDFKLASSLGDLTLARIIESLDSLVSSAAFKTLLHVLGYGCPAISKADLPGVATLGKELIRTAHKVLGREHVHHYYQQVVLDGICTHLITFQGWLVCARLFAALVCLPVTIVLAHDLLYRLAAYREQVSEPEGKAGREEPLLRSSLLDR